MNVSYIMDLGPTNNKFSSIKIKGKKFKANFIFFLFALYNFF